MVSLQNVLVSAIIPLATVASDAPVVHDSPEGVKYIANFKPNSTNDVSGSVEFVGTSNGSTLVNVNLKGLPEAGGPFPYHIHQRPVPANGDCYGTLLHLNPYNGSAKASVAAEKEVGDLAGKHGNIQGRSIDTSYIDPYVSLNPDDKAFPGGLSVVVHFLNNSRVACANITLESKSSSNGSDNGSKPSSSSVNAAASYGVSGVIVGAFAAGISLLI